MASIGISVRPAVIDPVGHGTIGTLTIDNPERRNAMNSAMYLAVPDAMAALAAEPDLRCIVIRGAGDEAFSAGSDISEFPKRRMGRATDGSSKAEGYDNAEHEAWAAIANARVPVIAAIHGPCRGGGIAIALHADIRIAGADATFAVPPASLGLAYPIEATERLVSLVEALDVGLEVRDVLVTPLDDVLRLLQFEACTVGVGRGLSALLCRGGDVGFERLQTLGGLG